MVKSISSDNIGIITNISGSVSKVETSDNFSNILDQTKNADHEKKDVSSRKKSGTDDIKSLTSGIIICKKCSTIYVGESATICAKCGNDISAQNRDNQKVEKTQNTIKSDYSQNSSIRPVSTPKTGA